jgi:hypothetical protein
LRRAYTFAPTPVVGAVVVVAGLDTAPDFDAPGLIRVPFFDRCPQPYLDEAQDVSIHHTPGY